MARGGVGTIITGFTSVLADDFYFGGMMRLSDNKLIPHYKKLVEIIHENDCAAISQLALGAFYKNGIEIDENEMTAQNVRDVINLFVNAAIRAEICGFDGVQMNRICRKSFLTAQVTFQNAFRAILVIGRPRTAVFLH